jgi:hypothetical protein
VFEIRGERITQVCDAPCPKVVDRIERLVVEHSLRGPAPTYVDIPSAQPAVLVQDAREGELAGGFRYAIYQSGDH